MAGRDDRQEWASAPGVPWAPGRWSLDSKRLLGGTFLGWQVDRLTG